MTRVLVVDDHPVFRKGLASLLASAGFEVCGDAATGAEAIQQCADVGPDVVVMDLGLPDQDGSETTAQILARHPGLRVVVVTMFDDDGSIRSALEAGACGYVLKDAAPEEIVAAVHAATLGATLLGSSVTAPIGERTTPSHQPLADLAGFTTREREVLDLVAKGLPNSLIAERLGLSGKTVANYVSVALAKLGAADRREAAALLRRR